MYEVYKEMAEPSKKKASGKKSTGGAPAPKSDLESFLSYEKNFRTAVEVSKLPSSENVDERRAYFANLQNVAENTPEQIKSVARDFNSRTPQPVLDGFAGILNRFYNDVSGGYFDEKRVSIVSQVEDKRLEGLVLGIKHPNEGSEERKTILEKINEYQILARINGDYDNRKIDAGEILNIASGIVVKKIVKDVEEMKKIETAKYIKEETWGYIQGTLAMISVPSTGEEARKVTEGLQRERLDEVYKILGTESERAGFVRESLGYLPAEEVRPIIYTVATAELKEE